MVAAATASRMSISTVCLSGALEDKLRAAAAAGFTGIELLEYDLVMSSWSPGRVAQEAADLGLSIDVYQPFHVEPIPAERFDGFLRRAERKFDLLDELGVHVLVCCSTASAAGIDDDTVAAEQLRRLAERAESRGVRLAFEAVPWGRIRTHEEAWRLISRVDHPALGLCLDSFHLLSEMNDVSEVDGIDMARVFHVQLADAPRLNLDVGGGGGPPPPPPRSPVRACSMWPDSSVGSSPPDTGARCRSKCSTTCTSRRIRGTPRPTRCAPSALSPRPWRRRRRSS